MSVVADSTGSTVKIVTDYNVAGRVAQFGRGVMEDVSRRLVGEMSACIKANIEAPEPSPSPAAGSGTTGGGAASGAPANPPAQAQVATAKPVNAIGLLFSVLWARLRGAFGSKT